MAAMRFIFALILFSAGALLGAFGLIQRINKVNQERDNIALLEAAREVQQRFEQLRGGIAAQLQGFSTYLENDRDFAMKLLIEGDRAASEITQKAPAFMPAMGFSLLDIADSSSVLLSSGHFPAEVGNSAAFAPMASDSLPVLCNDNIGGQQHLTLQGVKRGTIAGVPIYCSGGVVMDGELLKKLQPTPQSRILLSQGDLKVGYETIQSISPLQDNRVIINDTTYAATTVSLPFSGEGEAPQIIVVQPLGSKLTARSLLPVF
jgi:hypothetical protein